MTLREALLRRGVAYREAAHNHVSINCLFCHLNGETADTRFRLSINCSTGAAICFNCSYKSRHCFKAVLRALNIEANIEGELQEETEQEVVRLPEDFQLLRHAESDLDRQAIDYLHARGVTDMQVERKRIGISLLGRYAYRIIFPVRDGKKLQGIVARDFTDTQEPRYLNSKGEKGLYGCISHSTRTVILSEGIFKSLRIAQLATGCTSMALLGRDITEFQMEQLKKHDCSDVVVWPDPDKPGRRGAAAIASKLLEQGFGVRLVWPVRLPADEESLDNMRASWRNATCFDWRMKQKLLLG